MNLKRGIFISFLSIFFLLLPSVVFGVNLDLPFKSQLPPGTLWKDTRNCGQTSFLMINAYYNSDLVTEQDIKDLDDWIEINLGDDKRSYYGNYTSLEKLKMIAISYSGYQEDIVIVKKGVDISFLKDNLKNNTPILIDVYTNMLKYGGDDARHFMVLTGIDDEYVYVNDPGKTKGKNNQYTIEQFQKAWAVNGNQALVILPQEKEEPSEEPTPPPTKSLWEKFKDLFTGDDEVKTEEGSQLVSDENNKKENVNKDEEVQEEEIEELIGTYNLSFTNSGETIQAKPGEAVSLTAQIKNIGTADWNKNNISANVVGGQAINNNYYHNSWITKLRPTLLNTNVSVGQTGTFSFFINTPTEPGEYNFRIQAVNISDNFKYVEGGFWTVNLQVVEDEVVEEEIEAEIEAEIIDEKSVVEKIVDKVKEVVDDVVDTVKETVKKVIHYGGGGGGSSTKQDTHNTTQDDESEVVTENPEIIISSHNTSTEYTASSSAVIFGIKNEATETVYVNSSTANIVSSTAWELGVDLIEGENKFEIYGENSEGTKTVTSTVSIFLDNTPPSIPTVSVIQSEYATPTLYISWLSEDEGTGVSSYDVKYILQDVETELLNQTTSTNYDMEVTRLEIYNFSVRAYDLLGNMSDWSVSTEIVPDWPRDVVINEVAWMGSGPSTKQKLDEWLELYNNTDEDIDLSGWKLMFSGRSISWKTEPTDDSPNLSTVIPAHGYYLLERTDDDSIVDVQADGLFNLLYGINNDGEEITLFDNNDNVIDRVDCSQSWYAGSTDDYRYRTMARIDTNKPGSWGGNWETYQGIAPVARPMSGSYIYGSPGYANTGYWLLNSLDTAYAGLFDENNTLILTKENSPYIFYGTEVSVSKTLQIEPGVVLYGKHVDSNIEVNGSLIINGTAEEPIIFTSALDNNYVEVNRSLLDGEASPGDWSRIEVQPGGSLIANNAKFYYGGNEYFQAGGFVFGGKFFSNIIFNNEGRVEMSNIEFNNNFTQTNEDHVRYNSIIWSENASTTITNSLLNGGMNVGTVVNNGNGIFDNVNFSDLNIGIEVKGTGQIDLVNMGENNFQNITNYDWFPINIWPVVTSTTSTTST